MLPLTLKDAHTITGINKRKLKDKIDIGALVGYKKGNRYYIYIEDLERISVDARIWHKQNELIDGETIC